MCDSPWRCATADTLFERRIDICHETVRMWWNGFAPLFASDIRRQRVSKMRGYRQWRWYLFRQFEEVPAIEIWVYLRGRIGFDNA